MDIKILDSWLRDYLETKANTEKIAECLTLCGPSIEKIDRIGKDKIYNIEITTNRIDTASVYGIAREAAAILPRFKIKAKLRALSTNLSESSKWNVFTKKVGYLNAVVDTQLCTRFSAILIKNVHISQSPDLIKHRLESAGVRPINNVVDISNYIMLELGQPVHTFDYDKIEGHKMILRKSRKGEKITTLDKKQFVLPGNDIVIEDGAGRIIDLAGIMGGNLSAVDANTKNVLLFVQTYNPQNIRKTSMSLAQRTVAATIFEKGTDTELVTPAILKGVSMFKRLCKGTPEKEILNIYPKPVKAMAVKISLDYINKRLGIILAKADIGAYLRSLGFEPSWSGSVLEVTVPSFRQKDILDKEDILEEIARIHGYHNFPSVLVGGNLTGRSSAKNFSFEGKIKNILSDWGGTEIYTSSLVPKNWTSNIALKITNPLGSDSEYMRTSLMPSMVAAAVQNSNTVDRYFLFEMANVYIPRKDSLPDEHIMLGGIFKNYDYRKAKGLLEGLFYRLNLNPKFKSADTKGFDAAKCANILLNGDNLGLIGYPEDTELIYFELEVGKIHEQKRTYKPVPKFPPQIEDITFELPEKTYVGTLLTLIGDQDTKISKAELKDIYKNAYTFHIEYQDPLKTLNDKEVEKIREKIVTKVKEKFGGIVKN